MKKNRKLLGIKNPDALDFVLAIIFGIVTVGALWLGIFISTNKAYLISDKAWHNFVDAFTLKFGTTFTWHSLVTSCVIYLGAVSALVLVFASLIKKSFRGIVGAINVVLCAAAGALFFNFFYMFLNPTVTKITGIFPIGIFITCVFLLFFGKLSIDLSISYMNDKGQNEEPQPVQYIYINNPEETYDEDYNSYENETFEEFERLDEEPTQELVAEEQLEETPVEEVTEEPVEEVKEEPVQEDLDVEYIVESNNGEPATVEEVRRVEEPVEETPVEQPVEENIEDENIEYIVESKNGEATVEAKEIEEEVEEPVVITPVELKTVEIKQESGLKAIQARKLNFEEKLVRASKEVRVNYKELKNYFEELGFKCKIAKNGAIFYHKNIKQAVITVSGKSALRVYYKLDYYKYVDSSIPLTYVPDVRKYEKTPVYIKVKSDLSVRRAKQLMDDVKLNTENE